MQFISPAIGMATDLFRDYDQEIIRPGMGQDGYDLRQISSQEYGPGTNISFGNTLKGASAGAAAGPVGAVVGGVAGLATDLVSVFRRKAAERKFNQERSAEMQGAASINAGIAHARKMRQMSLFSGMNQINSFYGR
jgi:hypothetical protein